MPSGCYVLAAVIYVGVWVFALALARAAASGDRCSRCSTLDEEYRSLCAHNVDSGKGE